MDCLYIDYIKMFLPNHRKVYFSRLRWRGNMRLTRKVFYRAFDAVKYGKRLAIRLNRILALSQSVEV